MRYLLASALVVMCIVAAMAENRMNRPDELALQPLVNPQDTHDSPVQAGFAVITPVGAPTGGTMTVLAAFGRNNGPDVQQLVIQPVGVTTSAVVFVSGSGTLSRNLGVAIVNPDSTSANVTLTLRDRGGIELAAQTIVVEGHHQTSKLVTELFTSPKSLPRDLTGALYVTSSSPVAVAGLRFRGASFSALPVTSMGTSLSLPTFSPGVGGTGAVLLPQFAMGGGRETEIVLANPGTTDLNVRLDLFKQDGTALIARLNAANASSFTDLIIPAGGVLTLAPRNPQ
jgi:hypothetical protein